MGTQKKQGGEAEDLVGPVLPMARSQLHLEPLVHIPVCRVQAR